MLTKVKTTSKKALSVLLAFVMCFTALAICMPVIADAIPTTGINTFKYGNYYYYPEGTKFISAFAVEGASDQDTAVNWFNNNGYTRVDYDLNKGCGSDSNYIYIGYKTTTDINQAAATYIRAKHETSSGLNTAINNFNVNGATIQFTGMVSGSGVVYDVNQAADNSDYIYLYYTNNPSIGLPITSIAVNQSSTHAGHYIVTADDSGKASDLNAENDNGGQGDGGSYPIIYLHYGDYSIYTDVTTQMTDLKNAIAKAAGVSSQDKYTAASWQTYHNAINEANRIVGIYSNKYNAGYVTADAITAATKALNSAIDGLQTTIKLNATANGGTASATEYTVTCGLATTVEFPAGAFSATKEGYSFQGWSTDSTAAIGSMNNMTVDLGSTVYAIFSILNYNVYFVSSITSQTIDRQNISHGGSATAPEMDDFVTNDLDTHYVFQGWDTEYSNITESITVTTVYTTAEHNYKLTSYTAPTCKTAGSEVQTCEDCGQEKKTVLPIDSENHSNTTDYPGKDSTCREYGYTAYTYCNDCNKVVAGREQLPLADHTWGGWVTTDATCTEDGSKTRRCTVCNTPETETIPATGHSYGEWSTVKEATCEAAGRKQRTCPDCGSTEVEIINALQHNYIATVTPPTCTEQGYTTHTCDREGCGKSYIDSYVDATGHTWENVGDPTKEATCTESGIQYQECKSCGASQDAVIDALGHNWANEVIHKEADCENDGLMSATCDRCSETQDSVVIPALGHDWDEGTVTKKATCTEKGTLHLTCRRDICSAEKDVDIPALSHDWDEGTVITDATCTTSGEKLHNCNRCDETKTVEIPKLNHSYTGVVTAPTCTEQGYTTYTCSVCDDTFVDDYTDAKGHSNRVTIVPPTCTQQGYTVNRCEICGNMERTNFVDATGHNYTETIVAPTCTEQGYTLHECSVCNDDYKDNYVDALGHNYIMSKVVPTCTEQGYDLYDCDRCDKSYKENYIDALGHTFEEVGRVEPSGTQNGYILHACFCGYEYKEIVYADGKALVYITLYDSEGNPVTEATITFTEINTGKTFVITTDLNGYFTEVLPEGDYELLITKNGFEDTVGYISVYGGQAEIDIPEILVESCECYCHKTDFFSTIRRIFAKLLKILGITHDCCDNPDV